jgi:hypothetical protein
VIFKNFQRRLASLEDSSSYADAVLTFPDGSTRAVTFREPLGVFCAAASRCAHFGPGICEGNEQIPQQTESQKGPRPTSQYDAAIDLLGRAVSIDSEDHFLHLVYELSRRAIELESKKKEEVQ